MIFLWFGSTGKRNLNNKLKYSLDINFLDVDVIRSGNKLLTDLYIKPTDTHQYLEFSSCHVYHSKKSIPYNQALHFNRICSENRFFDNRSNQPESWLKDRGCNEKVVRQQILKARKFTWKDFLNQDSKTKGRNKLVFNFTFGFKWGRSLRDLLVRAKVPGEKEADGRSCGCQEKRSEVWTFLEEKNTLANKEGSDTYKIRECFHLDCNSENVVDLVTC